MSELDVDNLPLLLALLLGAFLICSGFVVFVICRRFKRKPKTSVKQARTLIVLGSGGHTAEMLALIEGLNAKKFSPVTWVIADTDKTSLPRLDREKASAATGLLLSPIDSIQVIPRSREVGQSWISTIWSTLRATFTGVRIVFRAKPDVILVNGPGTCVPIIIGALLWRVLHATGYPRLIFVESFCRVQSLSLTGKLMYPIADRFVVQWPDLQRYKRSQYLGAIF